jgi:hypothetical protein
MFDLMLNFPYFVCSTVKPTFLEKTHMTFYDCYENPIKSLQIPILSYLFLGKITSIQPIHPGFFPPRSPRTASPSGQSDAALAMRSAA